MILTSFGTNTRAEDLCDVAYNNAENRTSCGGWQESEWRASTPRQRFSESL